MSIRRLVFAASLYLGLTGCQAPGLQDLADLGSTSYAQPPPAQGNLLAALHQRGRQLLQVYQPTLLHSQDVKVRGYDTIAYTALRGCGPPSMSDAMVDTLRPDLIKKSADGAAYAFVLPPMTRYILQYGQCLSPAQIARARSLLATPQLLFSGGTLNHQLMSSASFFLLAEHFPDQPWADAKGKPYTSVEVVARYKELLLSRFRKLMADGSNEQLSPTYGVANLYPLLNLIDFAQDADVRTAAGQMAVAQIGLMRADSLDGALMPPLERENPPAQITSNPPTNARDVLWFYYGGFGPIDGKRYEPPYSAMLVASSWSPPQALLALKAPTDLPYDIETTTPSFSVWDQPTHPELVGGALIDKDFAIGAGNSFPDPAGYNDHAVTFRILIRGLQPVGAVECYQPYWEGDKGEDAWDTDRSSPFQQSWRSGRQGVLLYDIPASDPFHYPQSNGFFVERAKTADHLHQLAECRFPAAADELNVTTHGIFARYGKVFVALRSLGSTPVEVNRNPAGMNLKGFYTMKIRVPHAAIYYDVEPSHPGESVRDFAQTELMKNIHYDSDKDLVKILDDHNQLASISFRRLSLTKANALDSSPSIDGLNADSSHYVARSGIFSQREGSVILGPQGMARGLSQ